MTKTDGSTQGLPPPDWSGPLEGEISPQPKPSGDRPREIMNAEMLASLSSVVRRPPALTQNRRGKGMQGGFETALLAQARPVLRMSTGQLAYSVSDLVARRQAQCQSLSCGEAMSGLAALNLMARMFEHLAVLQSK